MGCRSTIRKDREKRGALLVLVAACLHSKLIPIIQNEPIVDPNCVLGQPLRPARKRPGSRSRGAYEARGATRNLPTEVGSSTRRHPVARC